MKNVNKIGAFTKMCCTIGNLPTSYMMSMTYEEQLLWLCNYLEKTIIPALNGNAEAVEELQAQFNLLKSYVDNYFEELDVQEEINNKLDDMAEKGELTDIIAQYLQLAGILAYNTLDDLENAENLSEGSFTKIYGKLTYNDGYGAFYKIRQLFNTDVIDGDNLVALTNYPTLVAEKIPDATINSILDNLTNINENINTLNEYMEYELETSRYTNHFRYYIDGTNGDDDNDGLTPETPFKTIDKFLNLANKRSDIRCYIIGAGTYEMSKTNLEHCSIHITSNLTSNSDVIITIPDDKIVFYQCHLNFNNITLENIDYFEGCSCAFYNCHFTSYFQFIGSTAFLDGCKINALKGDKSNLKIRNITIDGYAKEDNDPLYMYDSKMDLYGTITYEELLESSMYLFGGYFSEITMHGTISVTTGTTYNYSKMFLNQSILFLSTSDYNTLTNTYSFAKTRSLIIKDNTELPS